MDVRSLEKSRYSEWVIRNALYWLSPISLWTLDETDTHWQITFANPGSKTDQALSRLLNDYLLRERLMTKTNAVRDAIAVSVLTAVQERLSQ